MTDSEFLNWLGDRLVHVYGESENVDFVLKVRSLARKAQVEPAAACTKELREALKRLVEVYDAMGNPRGPALIAAEAVLAAVAQPVVDQEPASVSHNGSCGSQVSGKPASAEARMLRDLLARIHRDGGHYVAQHGLDKAVEDADLIVSDLLALQQASAEEKLPVGWLPNLVGGELVVPTARAEAGKGVERDAYVADLIDTFEQLRQILGTPEQDADALIAASRRLASESVAVSGEVSDERIMHLWDTRSGFPTEKYPLTESDVLCFARAVLALAAKSK